MMKGIIKKFSYVLIANICNAISKFLMIIFIANFLTAYELGVYTFALALTAPITLLFNMKMRSYIVANDNINFFQFTKLRKISNIIAIVVIIIISALFYNNIFLIIIFVSIIKIIDINSEFYQAFTNKEKIFEMPARIMIIRIIISTIIFLVILIMSESLLYSLLGQLLFLLIFLYFEKSINLSLVNYKGYKFKISAKELFWILIPLGIVQSLMSFSSNIPKYLLEYIGGFEEVGIFSAILYIVTIFNLFMTTLIQTLLPYLKNIYNINLKKYNFIINKVINFLALIVGGTFFTFSYFLGEEVLRVLFSNEFSDYVYLLYIFSFVIMFNISGWTYDSSLLLAGLIKGQPYILICISIITFVIGTYLISQFYLVGAGLTVLVFNMLSTISKALYYYYGTKKLL